MLVLCNFQWKIMKRDKATSMRKMSGSVKEGRSSAAYPIHLLALELEVVRSVIVCLYMNRLLVSMSSTPFK